MTVTTHVRQFRQPFNVRIGKLAVRISEQGIQLRGFGKKTWSELISWERVASLSDDTNRDVVAAVEAAIGERVLTRINGLTKQA